MLKKHVQFKHKLKDISNITWYLKMKISQLKDRSLLPSQKKYICDLFIHHKIENCASVTTSIQDLKISDT